MKFRLPIVFRGGSRVVATLAALIIGLGLGAGCDEGPVERFEAAKAAAGKEDIQAFSTFFTRDSADLIRNLQIAGKRSRIHYVDKPFEILPDGKIEDVFVEENYAKLTIEGRGEPKVIMLREDDMWKISLKDMTGFFDPLLED